MRNCNEPKQEQLRKDIPDFKSGNTVKVNVKVVEGSRERIQAFEGTVIRRKGAGLKQMFTVRKTAHNVVVKERSRFIT